MEIPSPPGKSTCQADASPCCRSRLTAEPDSALALAGKLFLLARLPPPPRLRALLVSCRALCGIAGRAGDGLILLWKCSYLRMPTASLQKGFVRRLPGDCGAWRAARSRAQPRDCEPARCRSLWPPSSAHPRPPAALTSTSCSVKATLQKEKCCQRWRHHRDCMLQMPLVCSQGCQGCQAPPEVGTHVPLAWRAALVQWKRRKVQSLDDTVPWDPPVP